MFCILCWEGDDVMSGSGEGAGKGEVSAMGGMGWLGG